MNLFPYNVPYKFGYLYHEIQGHWVGVEYQHKWGSCHGIETNQLLGGTTHDLPDQGGGVLCQWQRQRQH